MEPSPTPDATRFTEPCRAHRQRLKDARNAGFKESRIAIEAPVPGPAVGLAPRSGAGQDEAPVMSRSTTPSSQLVRGSAPIKIKSELAGTVSTCPVPWHLIDTVSSQATYRKPHDTGPAHAELRYSSLFDPIDQVLRHRRRQRLAADQHDHSPGVRRKPAPRPDPPRLAPPIM